MIITVEIEQFAKEIEDKLPQLSGVALENAKKKLAVLNRVSLEFMEYEDLMRKLALSHNEIKSNAMKMAVELRDLKTEVKHLKDNIDG